MLQSCKGNEPFDDKPFGNGGNKNKYSLLTSQVKNVAYKIFLFQS